VSRTMRVLKRVDCGVAARECVFVASWMGSRLSTLDEGGRGACQLRLGDQVGEALMWLGVSDSKWWWSLLFVSSTMEMNRKRQKWLDDT